MANLAICDLCDSKVKRDFINVSITGRIELYKGDPPPPPEGFKYRADEKGGSKMVKMWDAFGKYQGMVQYLEKPPKYKKLQIGYDLCETCGNKLANMLEHLRRKYQIEQKEIKLISEGTKPSGFNFLLEQLDDELDEY